MSNETPEGRLTHYCVETLAVVFGKTYLFAGIASCSIRIFLLFWIHVEHKVSAA